MPSKKLAIAFLALVFGLSAAPPPASAAGTTKAAAKPSDGIQATTTRSQTAQSGAANGTVDNRGIADPQFGQHRNEVDPYHERIEKEREKQVNKGRHGALKKDTDRLLQLAQELKQYVDKTNENMLSVDVIKKAEEIEKLARSVRNKMRGY